MMSNRVYDWIKISINLALQSQFSVPKTSSLFQNNWFNSLKYVFKYFVEWLSHFSSAQPLKFSSSRKAREWRVKDFRLLNMSNSMSVWKYANEDMTKHGYQENRLTVKCVLLIYFFLFFYFFLGGGGVTVVISHCDICKFIILLTLIFNENSLMTARKEQKKIPSSLVVILPSILYYIKVSLNRRYKLDFTFLKR